MSWAQQEASVAGMLGRSGGGGARTKGVRSHRTREADGKTSRLYFPLRKLGVLPDEAQRKDEAGFSL